MRKQKPPLHYFNSFWVLIIVFSLTISVQAYQEMATPKLHVSGRFLQDTSGKNVLLHGWFQPQASWFNGEGNRYSSPTDYTNTSNVAPCLNFLRDAATVMSDTNPKYGAGHGWYCSFVRIIGDGSSPENFAPGWNAAGQLESSTQFNGWINNLLVPYINHCRSRGLYVVICGNPSVAFPGGDAGKNMTQQYQQNLITFWQTIANNAGIKSVDNVMFEICNEPVSIETSFGANNWGFGSSPYWQALQNFMQPIVNAIRNTGADNIIWVPSLGWEGESQGFAQYPISGSNVGYAAHLYPAYGGVHDNQTAVQNLWNSNYKPAADLKPMIITEMMWFPNSPGGYDDLFDGTTAGFGNAAKNAIDNQGNVSYLIGFLSDNLYNLVTQSPSSCTLGSGEGVQAAFGWWPTYTWAAPGSGGGGDVSVPTNTWFRLTPRHATNKCLEVADGSTANGSNVQIWSDLGSDSQQWRFEDAGGGYYRITPRNATGRCLDVSGVSQDNGANIHIWDYLAGANQQWEFFDAGGGYYSIVARHSGRCVDVEGVSSADGANVHQWDYLGGANQEWSFTEVGGGGGSVANGTYKLIARHSGKAMDASGAGTANGTQIIQWTYGGGTNQQWIVTDEGNGEYSLIGVQSGKAVDVENWGTANGTKVQLWDYFGGTEQKYIITATDSGYYRISPTHAPDSCLDVSGISLDDGANVQLWQWLSWNNQQWAFQAP